LLAVIARREQWRADRSLVQRLHADVSAADAIVSGATLTKEQQPVCRARITTWQASFAP